MITFHLLFILYVLNLQGDQKYYTDVAKLIKEEFDENFKGKWHIIVGQSFGSFVTYEMEK